MYAGAFATSRIGTYVSGNATTDRITEYSVSTTRIDTGHDDCQCEHEQDEPGQREAWGAARMPVTAPLPAAELRKVVGAGEDGVDRGSAHRKQDPHEGEQQSDLPSGCSAPRAIVPRCSGEMPFPRKSAPPG